MSVLPPPIATKTLYINEMCDIFRLFNSNVIVLSGVCFVGVNSPYLGVLARSNR